MRKQIWEDADMKRETPVEGHAASFLPKGKKWKLVWNDEFDGDQLDKSKWGYRLNFWGKRAENFIGDEGIELDGQSHLKMKLVKKDGDYYSCQLQTGALTFDDPRPENRKGFWPFAPKEQPKFMHRYGYYEVRCRQPKNAGWHTAFWLQAPGIGTHPDPGQCGVECDIMENYLQFSDREIICGCGWNGYGQDSRWCGHFHFPWEETADGWHHYAVEWTPEAYTFYADGKIVGIQSAPECAISHVDEFILLTTETHGYLRVTKGDKVGRHAGPAGGKAPKIGVPVEELLRAELPDCFEVDYVRVFDEAED